MKSHPGVTARPIILSEDNQFDEVHEGIHEMEDRSNLSIPESDVAM
jgi:hypothetical protein